MSEPVDDLAKLLDECRARVTIDAGRSFYRGCTQCGKPSDLQRPHELFNIGHYPDGTLITRPMCIDCAPIGRMHDALLKGGASQFHVMKRLCELVLVANAALSADALPPDFDEQFKKRCHECEEALEVKATRSVATVCLRR